MNDPTVDEAAAGSRRETEISVADLLPIIRRRRRVMMGTFAVVAVLGAAAVILLAIIPQQYRLRTAVDFAVSQRREPVESPQIASQKVMEVYLPAALAELQDARLDPSNLQATAVGRTVLISSRITAASEPLYRALHQKLVALLIKDHEVLVNNVTAAYKIQIDAATKILEELNENIANLGQEAKATEERERQIRAMIEAHIATIGELTMRSRNMARDDNAIIQIEAQIREVRERISSAEAWLRDVLAQRERISRQRDDLRLRRLTQLQSLADAEREGRLISDFRISLPPTSLIPIRTNFLVASVFVLMIALLMGLGVGFTTEYANRRLRPRSATASGA